MATQAFIFKHEGTVIAARAAIRQLSEGLEAEKEVEGACYPVNADAYGTVEANLRAMASEATKLADKIALARNVLTK